MPHQAAREAEARGDRAHDVVLVIAVPRRIHR
jgi:hypothetical protein